MPKFSLTTELRILFEKNLLYTVEDLMEITGGGAESIRSTISQLKNPKYAGKFGPLILNQVQSQRDLKKRWGLPTAEEIFKKEINNNDQ